MSVMCDKCKEPLQGSSSWEFEGALKKKGGKRVFKVTLEDLCPSCVQKVAGELGIGLPGNFGPRKKSKGKGRKKKKTASAEPSMTVPPEPGKKLRKREQKKEPPAPSFNTPELPPSPRVPEIGKDKP